jgi:hypothetical protein
MSVAGTDADLRGLSLKNARLVLLQFGVPEHVIEKMTRWDRIAMVRKLSSEAAVAGGGDPSRTKFARASRYSAEQQQHQYKEQAQQIFDAMLRAISNTDPEFSSDESDDEEDSEDEDVLDIERSLMGSIRPPLKRRREEEEETIRSPPAKRPITKKFTSSAGVLRRDRWEVELTENKNRFFSFFLFSCLKRKILFFRSLNF